MPDAANRFTIEVNTDSGHPATLEFVADALTIGVTYHGRHVGQFHRATLRRWLDEPRLPIKAGDIELSQKLSPGLISNLVLKLPDVQIWVLSISEARELIAII